MSDKVALTLKEGAGVETPSQAIIAAASNTATVTDARGRVLTVKKISPLDRMRLFKVAGPELSANAQWMGMAALASSVVSVDGDLVVKVGRISEIEALVSLLDDDGLEAVGKAYVEMFGVVVEDEVKDEAKN